jgi:hypothetical protein
VDAAASAVPNAKEAVETASELAVREAALLVEFDYGGLGVGSELSRRGTKGVRRLQGVAPLHPAEALTTLADMDVELLVNGLARDLDLELLGDMGFVERAAAVGTDVGKRRLADLANLLGEGGWRWALVP